MNLLGLFGIEAKVALASVTLSPSTTPLVLRPRDPQSLGLRTKGKGLRINSVKSLVLRMANSLFALSWTVSTCPEPTGPWSFGT